MLFGLNLPLYSILVSGFPFSSKIGFLILFPFWYAYSYCVYSFFSLIGTGSTVAMWMWMLSVLKWIAPDQTALSNFSASSILLTPPLATSFNFVSSIASSFSLIIPFCFSQRLSKDITVCHITDSLLCACSNISFSCIFSSSDKLSFSDVNSPLVLFGFPM